MVESVTHSLDLLHLLMLLLFLSGKQPVWSLVLFFLPSRPVHESEPCSRLGRGTETIRPRRTLATAPSPGPSQMRSPAKAMPRRLDSTGSEKLASWNVDVFEEMDLKAPKSGLPRLFGLLAKMRFFWWFPLMRILDQTRDAIGNNPARTCMWANHVKSHLAIFGGLLRSNGAAVHICPKAG